MEHELEIPNVHAERASIRLHGDSRSRIQKKQEREMESLKQSRQQTQAFKASKTSEQYLKDTRVASKAVTAPATPLKSPIMFENNTHGADKSWMHDFTPGDSGHLTHNLETLQSRLLQLQVHNRVPRTDNSTQTSRKDVRAPLRPPIMTPPRIRKRSLIGWSDLFDAIVTECN